LIVRRPNEIVQLLFLLKWQF